MVTKSAWLIENGKTQGQGLAYMTFDPKAGMFTWTDEVYSALHLSRRKDAELIAQECEDAWRIVEHSFEEVESAIPPATPDPVQLGSKVSHRDTRDRWRQDGVVVEVHPFGEFLVKWSKITRPEIVLRNDLRML